VDRNIGTKPKDKIVEKSVRRTEKILKELQREIDSLKSRVKALEG
tara:strand:- start:1905 stop:2039 length:135 start_codon:yes stop_codon:yes gene_type:complete